MAVNVDWIKRLTLAAAVVHALMFIASLVVRIQHNNLTPNQMNPNGFLYQYYKPDILGDFNSTKSKPSHAIENIDQAYTQRCSGSKNESGNKLLVLKAEFDVDNARRDAVDLDSRTISLHGTLQHRRVRAPHVDIRILCFLRRCVVLFLDSKRIR